MVDVKRLAAEVLGIGESRIRLSSDALEEIEEVTTRSDIRRLIKEGSIVVKPVKGNSRGRWRLRRIKKRQGRGRGYGSRSGTKKARNDPEDEWRNNVRAMRRYLKYLKDSGKIDTKTWRTLYRMVKGNRFKNTAALRSYLITNQIISD